MGRLRGRLDKKVQSAIRLAEKAVRQAMEVADVAAVDAVLQRYEPAREFLGPILDKLAAHRHSLVAATAERLQSFLQAEPGPAQIKQMMASCRPFAGLVAAELAALQNRYDALVQRAVDDLLSLIGVDGARPAALSSASCISPRLSPRFFAPSACPSR